MMLHASVLFVMVYTAGMTWASDVIELKDSNFQSKVDPHDVILVEFYAPWCGHCKKLAPEYEKAATTLKKNDPPVSLAKVDCTAEKATCEKYGVTGYPTLKIFRSGEFSKEYDGPREADGIVKYMKSQAGPSSKTLSSVADAEKFLNNMDHSIIGFFTTENELSKVFQKVADTLSSEFRFAHTFEKEVLEKYDYKDSIVLFQPKRLQSKFEDAVMKYKGDASLYEIKNFIKGNVLGLCGHRVQSNAEEFKKPLVVAYYQVDYVKNTKGSNYWRNRVMKVGKKLKDGGMDVNFAICNNDEFSYELSEFGINDVTGSKPVVTARDSKDRKFVMKAEFSMDNFEEFVTDFMADKLEPYLKSEDVPEDNSEAVKVVVAKNFDEIVNNKEKDVLIEFYAPWCGHCKSLEPKYKELAEKLADESGITIAKMDATANDVPKPYEVTGFPTLYFSPKNSKDFPQRYNGGREVDDFIKYLAKHATDGLNGFSSDGKKKKKTEL